MATAIAFATACIGTFILATVFFRGAKAPEHVEIWGEPLMPQRRDALMRLRHELKDAVTRRHDW